MSQILSRHRVRGSEIRSTSYRCQTLSPSQYAGDWSPYYPVNAPGSFETIDDVQKPYGDGVWGFGPVIHQTCHATALQESSKVWSEMIWGDSGDGLLTREVNNYNALLNAVFQPTIAKVFPIGSEFPENSLDALRGKWYREGVPKVRAELDMLVTLLELRDLKQLWDTVKSISSRIVKLFTNDLGPIYSFTGYHIIDAIRNDLAGLITDEDTVEDVMKLPVHLAQDTAHLVYDVSNSWLEFNFGWAQVARDLMGVLQSLLGFRKKLEDLIIGSRKIHTWHGSYTDPNAPYEDFTGGMECGGHSWCPVDTHHALYRHRVEYNAMMHWKYGLTVKYRYTLPDWVTGLEGDIRALFSSLGLSPGLDTIWEVIPFSFVIDWFLPIGQLLQRYTPQADPVPVTVEILDVCRSRRVGASANIAASHRWCSGDPTTYEQMTYSFYERIPDITFLKFDVPQIKWPNLFQLSLGAALVGGKFKYKRWGRGS